MQAGSKRAMTLAEIIIVIVIIAIITGIFLAMPKKNVSKMDATKYFIAYSMLKRMQDEQLAGKGFADVTDNNQPNCNNNTGFCCQINFWLNTVAPLNCTADTSATLTNGLRVDWQMLPLGDERTVQVDLDGANGNCILNQDCHNFILRRNGEVEPQGNGGGVDSFGNCIDSDWLDFQVFTVGDNGNKAFQMGAGVLHESYCRAVRDYNNCVAVNGAGRCFIEPVAPLK